MTDQKTVDQANTKKLTLMERMKQNFFDQMKAVAREYQSAVCTMEALAPYDRIAWFKANIQRLRQNLFRKQLKTLVGYAAHGLTRHQLIEEGIHVRPKVLRLRAQKAMRSLVA